MYKFSLFVLALAVIAAFYFGWFGASASNDKINDKSTIELSLDKGKVKRDTADVTSKAEDLGRKIKEEAKEISGKASDLTKSNQAQLTLDKTAIELEPDAKADITVTRTGGDQKVMQLGLSPSTGSNLLASGGLFEAGAATTRIAVEAPKGSKNGTITIIAEGQTVVLTVSIKQ